LALLGFISVQATSPRFAIASSDIFKIGHIIVIMQENRSFDSYFGTFPGADGIPTVNGVPSVCVPNPATNHCEVPYHDTNDQNGGGPHGAASAVADIDGGKMDGFIAQAEAGQKGCINPKNPACTEGSHPDVIGYHDGRDIPNYWMYASQFVLQDRMFEPNASWSLPEHLFQVSEWSAYCTAHDPASCTNALELPGLPPDFGTGKVKRPPPIYAWTDLSYLLHGAGISWGYYVAPGSQPDCADDEKEDCLAVAQNSRTPGIWNPLPYFDTVSADGELGNIQSIAGFYQQAAAGKLPAVSWVVPSQAVSEHPPALVSTGQTYVTHLINAVMNGPNWNDCAIFVSWDDWGGFYDHVVPPKVDRNGYGLRVPGLVISPYAKRGYIDHQTLSFDAYVKFIEDDFLGGKRLDPKTDGRPDPRPDVREDLAQLGDLRSDFDFTQSPRSPLILSENPPTDLVPPSLTVGPNPLGVSPARIDFRGIAIGTTSAPAGITISNRDSASVDVTAIRVAGRDASDFILGGQTACQTSLARNVTCSFTVRFKPSTINEFSKVLISSNALGSPARVILSGTIRGSRKLRGRNRSTFGIAPKETL
jgi:phospholipase C